MVLGLGFLGFGGGSGVSGFQNNPKRTTPGTDSSRDMPQMATPFKAVSAKRGFRV